MSLDLKFLIEQLEIADPEVIDLRIRVISSFGNAIIMRSILDRQCKNRDGSSCYSCEEDGACSTITGIGHFDLGEINTAIMRLEDGNQHFRSKDDVWNSIIGEILLAKAYEQNGNSHQALIEYKKAQQLTDSYIRVHTDNYDELDKARSVYNELTTVIKQSSSNHPSSEAPAQAGRFSTNPKTNFVGMDKAYLSLHSLPIYGKVIAGADGEVHINPVENTFTSVSRIELDGEQYDLFSVGHELSHDRQITLIPQETYGWAKVRGFSMNGWKTPLDEKDYVLFRESQTANHNDYVVVSSRDSSGGLMYIVKKYDSLAKQLLSNSRDTSQSYDPIPIDNHKIFGVVIAVAKPFGGANSD